MANNILGNTEDSEECVNDTWFHAWNAMPPHRPDSLRMFFAKITRRVSFDRFKLLSAKKRGSREIAAEMCIRDRLCAGQLQLRKGIMDFFTLARRMPDVEFIWAGGFSFGKISDGYEEIKKEMEHLPENVRMLGLLDREVMNEVYNMADVMFLPSYEELFPMTILEAMNCRIPILVRDCLLYTSTIHGPIGVNLSRLFPKYHCLCLVCTSRALTSFIIVYPKIYSSTSSSATSLASLPTIKASSAS